MVVQIELVIRPLEAEFLLSRYRSSFTMINGFLGDYFTAESDSLQMQEEKKSDQHYEVCVDTVTTPP